MAGSSLNKFVFNNIADEIYALAMAVIEYTGQKDDATVSKLKMILVELLTNSLKHSGQEESIIEVETSGNNITIKKIDAGNGFALRCGDNLMEWPLPGRHHTDEIVTIYSDNGAILKANLESNCALQFFIEEAEEPGIIDIDSLSEHFGLMIITRSCDKFTYTFDIDTCTNTFSVSLSV